MSEFYDAPETTFAYDREEWISARDVDLEESLRRVGSFGSTRDRLDAALVQRAEPTDPWRIDDDTEAPF